MKVVKVRIRAGDFTQGEAQMVYPARYNAREVDARGVGPSAVNGSGAYSGHIGRGADAEHAFSFGGWFAHRVAVGCRGDADLCVGASGAAQAESDPSQQKGGQEREAVNSRLRHGELLCRH